MQINYELCGDNNWTADITLMKKQLDAARPYCVPRVLIIVNPGCPTGIYENYNYLYLSIDIYKICLRIKGSNKCYKCFSVKIVYEI